MSTPEQITRSDERSVMELDDHASAEQEPRRTGNGVQSRSPLIRTRLQVTLTFVALSLSLFLAALDFSIATTAVPTIANELHSPSIYTWIGSAYMLAGAAATPVWGGLSNIWGRKIVLLATVVCFAAGSAVCASATNMAAIISGRSIQGAAAGGMIIVTNICISDLFSMRVRGLYLGFTGIVWSLAGGIGPLLGGALTQYVSWRWNWWINLPASAVSFLILCTCLHVYNPKTGLLPGLKAVDWIGIALLLGLTLMILIGLNLGGVISPWGSPRVFCSESYYADANLAKESSPLRSGLLVLPITCFQAGVSVVAGAIINRTGRYLELIYIGMGLTTLGFGLFIKLNINTSLVEVVFLEIIAGIGVGLVFQPPLIALQSLVEPDDVAAATALLGFVRELSTAISIVIGGVIFQTQMETHHESLLALLPLDIAQKFSGNFAAANVETIKNLTPMQKLAVKEAYSRSLSSMWVLYASVAALGLALSTFISRQSLPSELVEVRVGLVKKTEDTTSPGITCP